MLLVYAVALGIIAGLIPTSPLEAARTLTGTIAQEMGEVVRGGTHYSVLFAMGLVLFAITFAINLAADVVLENQQRHGSHEEVRRDHEQYRGQKSPEHDGGEHAGDERKRGRAEVVEHGSEEP